MTRVTANGVQLACSFSGAAGPPLVLVHGSWGTRGVWALVEPLLAARFRVVAYDRRGHGDSERPPGQGGVREDAADLAALIEALDLAPAWVLGNSFGGSIALRLAAERPDLLRGVMAHEPPLFGLLAGSPDFARPLAEVATRIEAVVARLAAGDDAGGAELFVETVALGPGAWARMATEDRRRMIEHAPTFLDEARDPEQLAFDPAWLAGFRRPALLSFGGQSPPTFAPVVATLAAALPAATTRVLAGAGHVPHATHPEDYAAAVIAFAADPAG